MLKSYNTKLTAVLVVALFTTVLLLGPSAMSIDSVFAKKKYKNWDDCRDDHSSKWCKNYFKKHDKNNKNNNKKNDGNHASQGIGQSQSSRQNSQCVSGGDTNGSCNNISVQNQDNSGNNAAAQDGGGHGKKGKGGNDSEQGIGQSQSSRQNSQCVAGGSLGNSCNNISVQNQDNSGNNAAAQDGGGHGKGKNNGKQGIGQSQSSDQNAQCVSGEDATVSCNNIDFQRQVNSGNNALGQR